MARMHIYSQDTIGRWVPGLTNSLGTSGGGSGGIHPAQWVYAAASGGITNTSDVALAAAPGAGKANYLQSLQICNTSVTATEVVIKDGSTVIWRTRVGASMTAPVQMTFNPPLAGSNNTALNVACITNSTATYVSAQGFSDESLAKLSALVTPDDEMFDDAGNLLYDDAGNQLYLA